MIRKKHDRIGIGELVQMEVLYGRFTSNWGRENELQLLNSIQKNYPIGEIVFKQGGMTTCISGNNTLRTIVKAFKGKEVFFDLNKNEFGITTSPFQELEFWQIPFRELFCGREFYKFQKVLLEFKNIKITEEINLFLERYEAIGNQLANFEVSVVEIHNASESELVELTRILN